ncbi:MAG: biopolymer transporter ExbD [Planctomycetota bacterium]
MKLTTPHTRPRTAPPDITAMVDVVFLLIIFFLTTLSMEELERDRLDLPRQSGERESVELPPGIVINIRSDATIVVESRVLTLAETLSMISATIDETPGGAVALEVLVRPDRSAPLAAVNNLARGLVDRGVQRWRIATNPVSTGATP